MSISRRKFYVSVLETNPPKEPNPPNFSPYSYDLISLIEDVGNEFFREKDMPLTEFFEKVQEKLRDYSFLTTSSVINYQPQRNDEYSDRITGYYIMVERDLTDAEKAKIQEKYEQDLERYKKDLKNYEENKKRDQQELVETLEKVWHAEKAKLNTQE